MEDMLGNSSPFLLRQRKTKMLKIEISDELVEQGRQLVPTGLVEELLTRSPGDVDLGLSTWNPGPTIELYSLLENLRAYFVSSELGLLQHIHFWVQAFHIPPEGMTSGIGRRLGQASGTVLSVEVSLSNNALFLAFQIRYTEAARAIERNLARNLARDKATPITRNVLSTAVAEPMHFFIYNQSRTPAI